MSQQVVNVSDTGLCGALSLWVRACDISLFPVIIEVHFIWVYHRLEDVLVLSLRLLDRSLNFLNNGDLFRSLNHISWINNFLFFSGFLDHWNHIVSLI